MIEDLPISQCYKGDILAAPIIIKGEQILVKDTILNDYIKEYLINKGVSNIPVYSDYRSFKNRDNRCREFIKTYRDSMTETKHMLNILSCGKPLDFEKLTSVTDKIYKNINKNRFILNCLDRVRNVDEYTYNHSLNTAYYSMLIAKWLNLPRFDIHRIIEASLLHDIGKTEISNDILLKNGILTKDEYEEIKKRTVLGYKMVEDLSEIDQDVKNVILSHYERINGPGYPYKISDENIQLSSKIVAVADVFDAMTSDRVCKKKATPFVAFEMFQTVGKGMFDFRVSTTFMKCLTAYLIGANVQLSNGEIGEIVYIPLDNLTNPIVFTCSGYLDLSENNSIKLISML